MDLGRRKDPTKFPSLLLLLVGLSNIFEGVTALHRRRGIFPGKRPMAVLNVHEWGWVLIILGIVVFLVGCALLLGVAAARMAGVVIAMLTALGQVALIGMQPWLSLLLVGLSVLVVFELTARPWDFEVLEVGSVAGGSTLGTPGRTPPGSAPEVSGPGV
jgi:hypothetical protein